jgi:hypothetical protein
MRTFVLLREVLVGSGFELGFSESGAADGTLVGNRSSRYPCQTMLGGVVRMLKRANLKTWA